MPIKQCNKRCSGCAFTAGTPANKEPWNFIKAELARLAPFPFYCHDTIDWRTETGKFPSKAAFREKGMGLCTGWMEGVKKLAAVGYFKDNPIATKYYAMAAVEQLDIYRFDDDPETRAEALTIMQGVLERLWEKEKRFVESV